MKARMDIQELVLNQYELVINDKEYELYDGTLEDHIAEFNNNPWTAMAQAHIIEDIIFCEIVDFIDTNIDMSVELDY